MDATCFVCHITCTGLPITRAGPGGAWRRRLIAGNRNMTRSHQRMWGIDPCAGAHRQDGSLGSPRGRRASHQYRAVHSKVKSVGVPIRPRICAVLLGRRLLGHACQIPWVQSELESWSSAAARAGIGPLSLASGAFCGGFFFLTAPASRVSSYVMLPARVLAIWAWGMTTALGHCSGRA